MSEDNGSEYQSRSKQPNVLETIADLSNSNRVKIKISPVPEEWNPQYNFVCNIAGLINSDGSDLLCSINDFSRKLSETTCVRQYVFSPLLVSHYNRVYAKDMLGGEFLDKQKIQELYQIPYEINSIHMLLIQNDTINMALSQVIAFYIKHVKHTSYTKQTKYHLATYKDEEGTVWSNLLFAIHKHAGILHERLIKKHRWENVESAVIDLQKKQKRSEVDVSMRPFQKRSKYI